MTFTCPHCGALLGSCEHGVSEDVERVSDGALRVTLRSGDVVLAVRHESACPE